MTSYLSKYNVPGPRYTSYPTVPAWNNNLKHDDWKRHVYQAVQANEEISIYIHLPFCESLCTYCGCNTRITVNHSVETIYINAVLKEWELYLRTLKKKPRVKELHLGGGTPTFFSPYNLGILVEGILKTSDISPEYEFSFEGHPNNTTKHHLETLAQLGFRRVSLGIQDFDKKVQNAINRIQSFKQISEVTEAARSAGFTSINYDLIYGLPFQTVDSVKKTMFPVGVLSPDRIAFYSYAHVPWIKPAQRSYSEKDLPIDQAKLELYKTGKDLLESFGYKEIGMDHFALSGDSLYKASQHGGLHRNFMGYTTLNTKILIGLGVSSISDTWNAFAQNEKKIEDYYQRIKSNNLPVFKGHQHSKNDLVIRQFILDLMCRYEATIPKDENIIRQSLERLKELEEDGIVIIENNKLKITKTGKPFMRNVCMAFDEYLWAQPSGTKLYSTVI